MSLRAPKANVFNKSLNPPKAVVTDDGVDGTESGSGSGSGESGKASPTQSNTNKREELLEDQRQQQKQKQEEEEDGEGEDKQFINNLNNNSFSGSIIPTPSEPPLYEEEDEEIKRALAMAMAIQNNPTLTPDELKQMVDHEASLKEQPKVLKKEQQASSIQERFVSAFHLEEITEASSKTTNSVKANFKNLQESIKQTREKAKAIASSFTHLKDENLPEDMSPKNDDSEQRALPNLVSADNTDNTSDTPGTTTTTTTTPSNTTTASASSSSIITSSVLGGLSSALRTMAPPLEPSAEPVRLSAVVWKRRSGFGKLSSTKAWERRRICLKASRIEYYKTEEEKGLLAKKHRAAAAANNNNSNNNSSSSNIEAGAAEDPTTAATNNNKDNVLDEDTITEQQQQQPKGWMEQAALNLEKAKATLVEQLEDPNAPRGKLDLIKVEDPSISATTGSQGGPTPYCIAIRVRGETKWKFCFDTHSLQMEWLAALTDVLVQYAVDSYNENPNSAEDEENGLFVKDDATAPSTSADSATNLTATTSSNDSISMDSNKLMSSSKSSVGDGDDTCYKRKKKWEMENYIIRANPLSEEEEKQQKLAEDKKMSIINKEVDDDEKSNNRELPGTSRQRGISMTYDAAGDALAEENQNMNAASSSERTWILREQEIFTAAAIVNAALVLSNISSTRPSSFWYVLTFANFGLFSLLSMKENNNNSGLGIGRKKSTTGRKSRRIQIQTNDSVVGKETATGVDAADRPAAAKEQDTVLVQKSDFKPRAGSSTVLVKDPTDEPKFNGHTFVGWKNFPAEELMVRSHGYLSTKKKVPSPGSLYDCIRVDVLQSKKRFPDMATRVILPKVEFKGDIEGGKTWKTPDIFVISVSIPTEAPKMTVTTDDGPGHTICMYFAMRQDTRDILRRVTADGYDPTSEEPNDPQTSKVNAVKLFEQWCRRAPTDPKFLARFKLVPMSQNLKEIGLPGWISRYNGKPVLIKRAGQTGFLFDHPELSCMEFDISLHAFPYLAKQAMCYMKENYFKKILVAFGFVIEGRSDDELPECVIGLSQLCYPDPANTLHGEEVFQGEAPKAHSDDKQ